MKADTALPSTRPAQARLRHIHSRLASGGQVNARSLAAELETSPRTILRDLDHLRDDLGLPIAYDPVSHSFHYVQPVDRVRFGPRRAEPEWIEHLRDAGTVADFRLPLEKEPHGHLEVICQRHHVRPEHVLAAIVGETLADAVCNSRLMDTIVRAARVLATQCEEVPA